MGLLKWLGLDLGCEKAPLSLNDQNFRRELSDSKLPMLIDVWSDTCQPCLALVPTIKRLACKYEGQIQVAELNVSRAPKSAAALGVRGTPTVLFFRNGRELERVAGLRGQHYYEDMIEEEVGHQDGRQREDK